jgi:hypothetical protein
MGDSSGERRVGFWGLFVLIFSAVGSGPAGLEGVIGSCGVLLGLILIIVFPFFWGFVQALISVELSVKYSEMNGAIGSWCNEFFGKTLAKNAAVWVVLMQCSTSAFVTEVTVTYVEHYWPGAITAWYQQCLLAFFIIACAVLVNSINIGAVARVMSWLTLNAVTAFAVLIGVSIAHGLDASRFQASALPSVARSINWSELVNLLIWNSAGYDASASIISHVHKPRQNLPRATALVGCCIAALYVSSLVFPYLATTAPASDWQPGYFVDVARQLGGEWLATWIFITCALTNLQVYLSALMTAAYTVQSMAVQNIFPNAAVRVPFQGWRRLGDEGTPIPAIMGCALLSAVFSLAPLLVNLSLQAILFVFIMTTEIACFLRDDGSRHALLVPKQWQRRACIVAPVAISAWVLVVQKREVAAPVLGAVAMLALWTIPKEQPMGKGRPVEETVGRFGYSLKL